MGLTKSLQSVALLMVVSCLFLTQVLQAQSSVIEVKLWENGLPNSNGHDDGGYGLHDSNYKPIIQAYLPDPEKATGRAIVCFPGGGYLQSQPDHYANDWAPYYNELGIALIVLHYRLPYHHPEVTISDAMEAFRQTRLHAKQWHINPEDIGLQGLSAGGHLASTLATHYQDSLRAAFQVLIYPVISFEDPYAHTGSRSNFIGEAPVLEANASEADKKAFAINKAAYDKKVALYSNEKQVSQHTPRTFLAVSQNDRLVSNSVLFYQALIQHQVPAVLHTYPTGGHGWHIHVKNNKFEYADLVAAELKAWLASF